MSKKSIAPSHPTLKLDYYSVRNISCPEDTENGRKVYVGYMPLTSIVDLPTDANVRDYLLEAEGKLRKRPTQVHVAIKDTLKDNPENFSVLNSGIVIVARDCQVDEKERKLILKNPSIINGSQTQGVVRDFFKALKDAPTDEQLESMPHIKFEIVVTTDEDLIAEISIARNFQNDVMTISIAGRLGQLNELEESMRARYPESNLQKSETKLSDDYIKTERLLQVITALIPKELWPDNKEFNKVYAYSMKAKCLKEFQDLYKKKHDKSHPEHEAASELYQFYLDIAGQAWELFEKWKSHQGFQGTRLWALEREGREIKEVPDGIIFPILASLSVFAKKTKNGWTIKQPELLSDEDLIRHAKSAYQNIANSNPWNMGKSKACYTALYEMTSIYKKLSK